MAWPMMEWVLDQKYAHLHHQTVATEYSFLAFSLPESRITPALEQLEQRWPTVKAFSLPSVGGEGRRPHIELGVKGNPTDCASALAYLREQVLSVGGKLGAAEE